MENVIKRYCRFVASAPLLILCIALIVTCGAASWLILGKPLKLDTNFASLIPDEIPCVVESNRISKLMGATDYLIIAVESPVEEHNRAFIEEIAPKIMNLPEVTWTAISEDKDFFRERFPLYLDMEDLRRVVDRARARVDYEKRLANPFYIDLEEEAPPDISVDDIIDKYREILKRQGVKGVLGEGSEAFGGKEEGGEAKDYFASEDGTIYSLLARTTRPSTDLDFGRSLVEKVDRLIVESSPDRNQEMVAEVVGSFRNRHREFTSIVDDIFSSFALSLSLIVVLIVLYFRRVRAVVLVSIPLVTGIVWTMAVTALVLGRLNLVTALIFAVLLGLGIDFGIHLSMRYFDERASGSSLETSLFNTIRKTGRAILTAGVSTAGALAILIFSRFKGFSEFGIIATMGIFLCLASYLLLLPALAALLERITAPTTWRLRGSLLPANSRFIFTNKMLLLCSAALILVTVASVWLLPGLSFEYNFRNLRSESVSTNIHYGKSIGGGTSPVVALLPTGSAARELTRSLERVVRGEEDSPVPLRRVFSLYSFVPENQEEKIELLRELRASVDEALRSLSIDDKVRKRLENIREWTKVEPFDEHDLPEWVLAKFREKDGTLGRMVYLDSGRDDYRVDEIAEFYDHYGSMVLQNKQVVHPASSGFILVEVIRAVQQDGLIMTVGAVLVVLVILLADFRSVSKALFTFLPLLVGLSWTFGVMVLLDIRIGLYNMLVLPTLLGVGIDASVHFYHAYLERGRGQLPQIMRTTCVAIIVAAMTTCAGFVGLTAVSHMGLRSIGILAVIGIAICLLGTLCTMPLLILAREASGKRKGPGNYS